VTRDDRQRERGAALDDVEVGVADAAGGEPDQHVRRAHRGRREILQDERFAGFVGDHDPHCGTLLDTLPTPVPD
jgi:hypothetical protein